VLFLLVALFKLYVLQKCVCRCYEGSCICVSARNRLKGDMQQENKALDESA
jgi:hypothetical protein